MQSARCDFVQGYNGSEEFVFSGDTESGRNIAVHVPKNMLMELARNMQYTASVGHAVWHFQNPDSAMPCSSCRA